MTTVRNDGQEACGSAYADMCGRDQHCEHAAHGVDKMHGPCAGSCCSVESEQRKLRTPSRGFGRLPTPMQKQEMTMANLIYGTDITSETITRDQIIQLRTEATRAGDDLMADICGQALAGDEDSIRECERVIADAAGK